MIDVEAKRAEAKGLRGVTYDARIDRFTAEIYVGGVRRWLGSYPSSQQAAEAHAEASAQREPVVRRSAFNDVYRAFRDRHGGDRTDPPVGAVLEYDGQKFKFCGLTWRKAAGGRSFAYLAWESDCKACGAVYRTMTPAPSSVAKGITRNCPEHVKASRFGRKEKPRVEPERMTALERVLVLLEDLGTLYDRMTFEEVLPLAQAQGLVCDDASALHRMLRMKLRHLAEDGASSPGFALADDAVVFS